MRGTPCLKLQQRDAQSTDGRRSCGGHVRCEWVLSSVGGADVVSLSMALGGRYAAGWVMKQAAAAAARSQTDKQTSTQAMDRPGGEARQADGQTGTEAQRHADTQAGKAPLAGSAVSSFARCCRAPIPSKAALPRSETCVRGTRPVMRAKPPSHRLAPTPSTSTSTELRERQPPPNCAPHGLPRRHVPPAGHARQHGEDRPPAQRRRSRRRRCAEHPPEAECRRHGHLHPLRRHNRSLRCVTRPSAVCSLPPANWVQPPRVPSTNSQRTRPRTYARRTTHTARPLPVSWVVPQLESRVCALPLSARRQVD